MVEAIETIPNVAHQRGITTGIFAATADAAREHLRAGFSLVAVGSDALLLGRAARRDLEIVRRLAS